MSYILPQVQVFQMFSVLPTATTRNLNAFVFGPNYQLFRYAQSAEKELIGLGAYNNAADTDYAYPNQPGGSTVDLSYVKLYMENVWAQYALITASNSNPVVVMSDVDRNKLRAMPIIGPVTSDMVNVTIGATAGGCFYGGSALPEEYAFVPYGGTVGGVWNAAGHETVLTTGSGERGHFAYRSSNGLNGSFVAPVNPLVNGTHTVGPFGIMLDLDDGGDHKVRSPLTVRFEDTAGTDYFDMSINWTELKSLVDWDLDTAYPLKVNITTGGGLSSVTFNVTTKILAVVVGTDGTLAKINELLVTNGEVDTYFTVGTVSGDDSQSVNKAIVLNASVTTDLIGAGSTKMIPDCSRLRVTANPYTFVDGNGYTHSPQFKARGVKVGDRVKYSITDDHAVVYTGETKVVGFEADPTSSSVGIATPKATNTASQNGDESLDTGDAIVQPGADDQRMFDGVNTKVYALAGTPKTYFPGSLAEGILDDTYVVTITVPGLKGTAQATVQNASGTYYRTDVLIEATGSDDGQIYVGDNMYINFDKGGSVSGCSVPSWRYIFV